MIGFVEPCAPLVTDGGCLTAIETNATLEMKGF